MYYRILGGITIQLSNRFIPGYKPVIIEEPLPEKEGFYINTNWKIINNEVHQVYEYMEIVDCVDIENCGV